MAWFLLRWAPERFTPLISALASNNLWITDKRPSCCDEFGCGGCCCCCCCWLGKLLPPNITKQNMGGGWVEYINRTKTSRRAYSLRFKVYIWVCLNSKSLKHMHVVKVARTKIGPVVSLISRLIPKQNKKVSNKILPKVINSKGSLSFG